MNTWGVEAEQKTRDYLESMGYRWICSNYLTRWGEIDLIMEDGDVLVFVEVKFRTNKNYGDPEESITPLKMKHLERAALMYIHSKQCHERCMRFDVVIIGPDGFKHYENAFMASGGYY